MKSQLNKILKITFVSAPITFDILGTCPKNLSKILGFIVARVNTTTGEMLFVKLLLLAVNGERFAHFPRTDDVVSTRVQCSSDIFLYLSNITSLNPFLELSEFSQTASIA